MGRERIFLDIETQDLYGDLLFVGILNGKSVKRYGKSFKVPREFRGYNLKYDLKVMLSEKMIDFSYLRELEIEDLYVLSRLVCPDLNDYSLQGVISSLYKEDIGSFENGLTRKQLEELNARQLRYMSKLYSDLYPEIERQGLEQVYRLENGLVPLIAEMEFLGILIDEKKKRKIEKVLLERRKQVISQLEKTFGNINLNSPKQLREVLYGKFKIKPIAYTPSGEPSTAHEVLEELALKYDFIKPLLEYRKIEKLLSTYLTDRMTGRVKASFNSLGTATGRFSSSNPNLQNIPVEDEFKIRDMFVAEKGKVLIVADYSQIELRVLAHFVGGSLLQIYKEDRDLHDEVAKMFDIERRVAKAINFGIVYGMSPYSLASTLDISEEKAKAMIDRYYFQFGVRDFLNSILDYYEKNKYVRTILGRKRYLGEEQSYGALRRKAINTVVQGSAAEIVKIGMLNCFLNKDLLKMNCHLLIQVHDELVFECPEKYKKKAMEIIKEELENISLVKVPLKVEIGYGRSWYEAKR